MDTITTLNNPYHISSYKVIYDPKGEAYREFWNNIYYIRGKPMNLHAVRANSITILNEKYLDKEWFDKNIAPFGALNKAKVLNHNTPSDRIEIIWQI